MFRVLSCLATEHDLRLVLAAGLVCMFGAFTVFSLIDRALATGSRHRTHWLLAAGLASGTTIWATHFVAMLAYDGGLPVGYTKYLTGASILVGIAASVAGLYVAFGNQARLRILPGGTMLGLGIGAMHFTGMAALEAPARLTYDPVLVIAALAAGATLAVAALRIFDRRSLRYYHSVAAACFALGICTLHFTAMSALTLTPDPSVPFETLAHSHEWMAGGVMVVAAFLLTMALGLALFDHRLSSHAADEARRLRSLANASLEGVLLVRGDAIIDVNDRFLGLIDASRENFSRQLSRLFPKLELPLKLEAGRSPQPIETSLRRSNGALIPVEISYRETDHGGEAAQVVIVRDLRERKAIQSRIEHLAHYDILTDLPNRALFQDRLSQALTRAARTQEKVALLYLDLDGFKAVNDIYGHAKGDEILRSVAELLKSNIRESDTLARLGGDEFAIIQTAVQQPDGARILAARLLGAFESAFGPEHDTVPLGVSIGVALYPDNATEPEVLLRNGDVALYRAKNAGRGACCFFEASMDEALRERRSLEHDLRLALAGNQLSLVYQPQADMESGEITGFEALLRWEHPTRGLMPTQEFINLAEECGLIVQIGRWVLRKAAEEAARWERPLRIAVNLSPIQFQHGDLTQQVEAILAETGLDPNRLELEVTEGVLLRDRESTLLTLQRLKALGIRIAMDDFGTGYSSLSNLQSFPFDKIKIDRSFVMTLETDATAANIVRAIIGLGHSLKLPIVAEGVETEFQLELLRTERCTEVQGYLVSRPQPIGAFGTTIGHVQKKVATSH